MNKEILRLIAREIACKTLSAELHSPLVESFISGYIAGHTRAACAGYNFLNASKEWLHHPSDWLTAARKDLEYELEHLDERTK